MKLLIIRFSSFGDIVQAMGVVDDLTNENIEVHWVTRKDFVSLVSLNSNVKKIWGLDRNKGWRELYRLGLSLSKEKYDIVYDAHSSIRSTFLRFMLSFRSRIICRSKQRGRRILLFYLGINTFPRPFRGMLSYRRPLQKIIPIGDRGIPQKWHFEKRLERKIYEDKIVLCPGAAWKMKRWPLSHWKELLKELVEFKFVLLGGEKDTFCEDLKLIDSSRITNMAGKLSLIQSCQLVSLAPMVIAADTGIIHVADILGVQGISLIGPTAFGFPSSQSIFVLEKELSCRPCSKDGRGRCSQKTWQKCMVDISPKQVAFQVRKMLQESGL